MHAASDSAVEHSLEGGAFLFLKRKWIFYQKHQWHVSKSGYLAKNTSGIFPKVGVLPKTQVACFQKS
jgi:hypothetical protein